MTSTWQRLRQRGDERGATETLEAAIWVIALLAVLLLGIMGSQYNRASSAVSAAAAAAARAASLSTTPTQAAQDGQAAAEAALGTRCTAMSVTIDSSQLTSGRPGAAIRAEVSCTMTRSVAAPGFPSSFTTVRAETSPVDLFREGR